MDPTLTTQLGAAGITVGVLIAGMRWIASQYVATQGKLDLQAQACQARESQLVQRIQSLEDGRNSEAVNVIVAATSALQSSAEATRSCAEALQANARAFERLTEESGLHRSHRPT